MINSIIGNMNDRRCVISKLQVDNIEIYNSERIVNSMASFYASIAKKIPNSELNIN